MTRVVIVGSQFMATTHAQVLVLMPDVEIVAVVARDTAKAGRTFSQIKPGVRVCSSLAQALEHDADVVDICVPTDLHGRFIVEAAEAGRHVFCEKPIALTVEDAERSCRVIGQCGVIAQIGHCLRFWPEYQKLQAVLRTREFGPLRTISFQRYAGRPPGGNANWLNQEARSGGAAVDLHIHDVDMVCHLFGLPPAVSSRGFRDEGGWSAINTLYHYEDIGVSAEAGWHYPDGWKFQMAFTAVFEEGCLQFDCRRDPTLWFCDRKGRISPVPCECPSVGSSRSGLGNVSELGGYYNQLRYFIDHVQAGTRPDLGTPRQAADALHVTLSELESAAAGHPVSMAP